ncbi:MAG: hypothetical protein ACREFQ_10765, partial [Stellaceae bacterium]
MATTLKRMKIREISLVDAPASPGANIVLAKRRGGAALSFADALLVLPAEPDAGRLTYADIMKAAHDVSDQPRDDHGRWTSGTAAAIRQGVRRVAEIARTTGRAAAKAVNRTLDATRMVHPRNVMPVRGGGVEFQFQHPVNSSGKVLNT